MLHLETIKAVIDAAEKAREDCHVTCGLWRNCGKCHHQRLNGFTFTQALKDDAVNQGE
jgi:hypothetical protein